MQFEMISVGYDLKNTELKKHVDVQFIFIILLNSIYIIVFHRKTIKCL